LHHDLLTRSEGNPVASIASDFSPWSQGTSTSWDN
jgi:hypothetical protein